MALNVNMSHVPTTVPELVALVQAVRVAHPSDETDFIEWKSTLDLSAKVAHVHIAGTILGFANRMPDEAAKAFDGYGLLLVGVEPGGLQGVVVPDPVELDRSIVAYTGPTGPRWRPTAIRVAGQDILVIHVEPPQWGDPIHVARKSGERIEDGMVYVRRNGGTRPATSEEQAKLQERLLRRLQALAIDVVPSRPDPVRRVSFSIDAQEEWVNAERSRLLAPLRSELASTKQAPRESLVDAEVAAVSVGMSIQELQALTRRRAAGEALSPVEEERLAAASELMKQLAVAARGAVVDAITTRREDRTPSEYERQVDQYLKVCRARLEQVLRGRASRVLDPFRVRVINLSAHNFSEVEVAVHFAGDVDAIEVRTFPLTSKDYLPRPPRTWGRQPRPMKLDLDVARPSVAPTGRSTTRGPRIEPDGSVTITFLPVHLRPEASVVLDPLVLLVGDQVDGPIHGSWRATSTATDGVARGEFTVSTTEDSALTVVEALAVEDPGQR